MAASYAGRACLYRRNIFTTTTVFATFPASSSSSRVYDISLVRRILLQQRAFTKSSRRFRQERQEHKGSDQEKFGTRLGKAWRKTKIEWKPIPVGLGIAFLGFLQFLRIQAREERTAQQEDDSDTDQKRPPKRQRIYPTGGGWQVSVMSTLPLKAISRVWGRFNELTIPYYLRVPGFKLYGWIFGVNFDEVAEPDLHTYPNLASFFYRELKPGLRPLDPNPKALLSPADARVLQFGTIDHGEVEQVKGMTYKLDALLGNIGSTSPNPQSPQNIFAPAKDAFKQTSPAGSEDDPDSIAIQADQEFAQINGISYTLPNIFSGSKDQPASATAPQDASTKSRPSSEAAVSADLASESSWWSPFSANSPTRLHYIVVYLAPGDYHRFHSPASWVCTTRRHFAGELYSVSPYVQRTLPGLFTLNERVVLLGKWKYGFFSYVPVGATNVGSIRIKFDKELRTNSLTTDTEADRQAALAADRGEPYSGFSEATYAKASKVLGGHALRRGEEMGGFALGSSIVIVFEAPAGTREHNPEQGGVVGSGGGPIKGGWKWTVETGQTVKVGQALGYLDDEE